MADVRKEQILLLWSTVRETALAKGSCSSMGDGSSVHMSAEEQSCLEGMYTVRRSENQAGDKSEKKMNYNIL